MAALPLLAAGAAGLVLSPPLMHPSLPRGVVAARGGPALALAEPASSAGPGRPLTVAIAGGGVGGLTTALAMLKAGFDVTVYEKTGQFARFGGPIQFASNALSALKAIDERLFERVIADFTFTGTRRCGIKDGLRADGSFRMTPVADPRFLFDPSTPADWYLEFPLKACADFFDLPYTGVIDRPDLQDILLDECRAIKPDFIVNGAPVASYTQTEAGVRATLSDGSVAEADVLVGSDGIWSTVRAQMYGEGEVRQTAADGLTRQGCPYSGYTVFAGEFVPERGTADFADYFECGYKVYIGPRKYFVTSDVGDGRAWYSFLCKPPGTKRAGDSWEGGASTGAQGSSVIADLKQEHAGWTDEVIRVLESTPPEAVEQRDLYDRPPELFRSWADGGVLVGDAVHPMMPNLGQGGCQAIEDALELTRALSEACGPGGAAPAEPQAVREALQTFVGRRKPRAAAVSLLSRLASDLIINFFDTPWSPHDERGKGVLSYLTFAWKPLLQYLIFPLQFLFLYSYHPSGGMGELPKRLEAEWRERHRKGAEEAFAKAAKGESRAAAPSFFAKAEADAPSDNAPQPAA